MVRSPHAHARIRAIDTRAAEAAPGVLAVLTGRDMLKDGLQAIPHSVAPGVADVALENRAARRPSSAHVPDDGEEVGHCRRGAGDGRGDEPRRRKGRCRRLGRFDWGPAALGRPVLLRSPLRRGAARAGDATSNISIRSRGRDEAASVPTFASAAHVVKFRTWIARASSACRSEQRAATGVQPRRTSVTRSMPASAAQVQAEQQLARNFLGIAGTETVSSCTRSAVISAGGSVQCELALVTSAAPSRSDAPSNGPAARAEQPCAITRRTTSRSRPSSRSTATSNFLSDAPAQTSPMSAPYRSPMGRWPKVSKIMSSVYHVRAVHLHARATIASASPTSPIAASGGRSHVRHRAADRSRGAAIRLRPAGTTAAAFWSRIGDLLSATRSAWSMTAAPVAG